MPASRVGILIASLGGGGAERMALRLAGGLHRAGRETILITTDATTEYSPNSVEGIPGHLSRKRRVRLSPSRVSWPTPVKMLMGPYQWGRLETTLKKFNITHLVSLMERANILNLAQTSAARRVISIRTHYSLMMAAKSPLKRRLVKTAYQRLLPRADKIIFNSIESQLDFTRHFDIGRDKPGVIYNFCDVDQLRSAARAAVPEALSETFKRPVVITSGRLSDQKGQWHLLRAFKRVSQTIKGLRLVILGQGPLRQYLGNLAADLNMADRVVLPGFIHNPMALIGKAALFVLPSLWEGFPNVLLEAMALGMPVVAADCQSGPRELLLPDSDPLSKTDTPEQTPCGMLCPGLDGQKRPACAPLSPTEQGLAEAMIHMLEEKSYRDACGRAAGKRAMDFTPSKILLQWERLLERV